MTHFTPSQFLQIVLTALLPVRDQEAVAGDLLEAYAERSNAQGAFAANLWYARQIASFAPHAFAAACRRSPLLVLLCCFTAACGLWLGSMDILLHHHDLPRHESIAALIVGQGLLTLLVLPLRQLRPLRWFALLGAVAVTWLGGSALYSTLHSNDTEGYILIIATALILQAALTGRTLLRPSAAAA